MYIKSALFPALILASLGYFVDVYDIVLFSAVRVSSLKSMGFEGAELVSKGILLSNIQLTGMLIGGFFWGMLADKIGRARIFLYPIFIYSFANFGNSFVNDIFSYSAWRFIAGFGLAGELGLGVTLVSELIAKEKRGLGAMLIAVAGVVGGMCSGIMADILEWRHSYMLASFLGFALLVIRWHLKESDIYQSILAKPFPKGDIMAFFKRKELLSRYLTCFLFGAPIFIFVFLFGSLAPEIAKGLGLMLPVTAGMAIMSFNIGFGSGEIASTYLSAKLQSRKKPSLIFLSLLGIALVGFFTLPMQSILQFYVFYGLFGFGAGYFTLFLVMSAEQFGTNLRATAVTSLPNMVRVVSIPASLAYGNLHLIYGVRLSLAVISLSLVLLALLATTRLKETYGESLEFEDPSTS